MNIYFKEDDLWVLITQHVESWSYSDTGLTAEETDKTMLVIWTYYFKVAAQLRGVLLQSKISALVRYVDKTRFCS